MLLKLKKSSIETVLLTVIFLLSLLNTFTLLLFYVLILFLFMQKSTGALKIIILIFIRTIINPELAVSTNTLEFVKMGILSLSGLYLISKYNEIHLRYKYKLNPILLTILLFFIYNIFVSLFFGSLPIVSIAKLVFYVLVFCGVMIGVARSSYTFNVFYWLKNCLTIILYLSLITIPLPLAYETNGRAFQGILDHPNMFGIFFVMYLALIVSGPLKKMDYLNIIMTLVMISISDSRTALISALVVLSLKILCSLLLKPTYINLALISYSLIIFVLFYEKIVDLFIDFLAKGGSIDNILFSRESQIGNLISNIQLNPIWGNGFSTPVLPYRSFLFSTDAIVEPGNLILAVISYSGLIGFIIFLTYMWLILFSNKESLLKRLYLFITPIIVSMGEMVFFSSNSIGPFCYILFAIYIIYDEKNYENSKASL
ncbi:hypothetical protein JEOAER750_01045 [Jeotgalicoccus aerolatus]|uniref:O-Antigen ligase n=1 Tax=Jeotgalicoccus aerolatus TaxID=709510 RepID=A0ABS4HLV8_9STAP|nr:hypothetical protein [Jeotgalicoccus aerolatus]MBP1951897.1 hypothetical protein [Jeotgalicoccus aerolatus]GGD93879.1 hypothetical protein GCM10007273_02790 [Jeotgalicoccus aerolatus]CAD2074895.1 hypothetical protein JEOAER750_01045 [Jeotgalicoccus aerolatus]